MMKKLAIIFVLGIIVWFTIAYFSAKYLVKTNKVYFENILELTGRSVKELSLKTEDNINISVWYINNNSDKAIILLSGIKGNRLLQISRAKFYLERGYSVLMPDLRGTGKSSGNIISFGWHEQKDLLTCVNELKRRKYKKIAASGQSLGAATIVYTNKKFPNFDFIVLESCYDNIENAFKNRIKKYNLPYFIFKPIEFFTEQIIEAKINKLTPDILMKNIKCPVLILAGDAENQIPLNETLKIYKNCLSEKKKLHIFKKGKHEDFHSRFKDEYEAVLIDFLMTFY